MTRPSTPFGVQVNPSTPSFFRPQEYPKIVPLASAILTVLLSLSPAYCPPSAACTTPAQRHAHLAVVSRAIARASQRATCTGIPDPCHRIWPGTPRELAAVLVAIGFWESRFSRRVQAGKCPWSGCTRWNRRAHSDWQIESSPAVSRPLWRAIVGLGQSHVDLAAWTSARLLGLARGRCGHHAHWMARTVSCYATGSSAHWPGADRRARMAWWVGWRLARMRALRRATGASSGSGFSSDSAQTADSITPTSWQGAAG